MSQGFGLNILSRFKRQSYVLNAEAPPEPECETFFSTPASAYRASQVEKIKKFSGYDTDPKKANKVEADFYLCVGILALCSLVFVAGMLALHLGMVAGQNERFREVMKYHGILHNKTGEKIKAEVDVDSIQPKPGPNPTNVYPEVVVMNETIANSSNETNIL